MMETRDCFGAIFIVLTFIVTTCYGNGCTDKQATQCPLWAPKGECSKNPAWMLINCRKSCKNCKSDPCHDNDDKCALWAKKGECEANSKWMRLNCRRSCKVCSVDFSQGGGDQIGPPGTNTGGGENPNCKDSDKRCGPWATSGECGKNSKWMHKNCKKSCKKCGGGGVKPSTGGGGSGQTGGGGSGQTGGGNKGQTGGGSSSNSKDCQIMRSKGINVKFWRKMDMAIFVSPSLFREWSSKNKGGHTAMVTNIKTTLAQKLNEVYNYDKLNGVDINFIMVEVKAFSQSEASHIVSSSYKYVKSSGRDAAGTASFCNYQNRLRSRTTGAKWDIAMYLVNKAEGRRLTPGAAGRTMSIGSVCKTKPVWNCGIVHGNPTYDTLVYDKLFAHETGHLIGFMHPRERYCMNGIMTAPGKYFTWSQCIKNKAKEIFNDDWVYPCMDYQCGVMPKPTVLPGGATDADKKVLDKLCTDTMKDGKVWTYGAAKGAKGSANSRYTINSVLWANPQWWLIRNACRGIPCGQEGDSGVQYSGVKGEWMRGKACGHNKKCQGQPPRMVCA